MSRIGNQPVSIPKGVTVSNSGQTISVKGPAGNLSFDVPAIISFVVGGDQIKFSRANDERESRAMHGTARARTANMVQGCAQGWQRKLEINGVGYRAAVKGKNLDLTLGFSHPISYPLPDGVKAVVEKDGSIVLTSADKAQVGQVAADIRAYRPPEPYKGKGVKYAEERIIRKEGKAGKK
jgi:large subunit ribosomal protein L6